MRHIVVALFFVLSAPVSSNGKYIGPDELISIKIGDEESSFNYSPVPQTAMSKNFNVFFELPNDVIAIADYNGTNQKLIKIYTQNTFSKSIIIEPDGYKIVNSEVALSKHGIIVLAKSITGDIRKYFFYNYDGNLIREQNVKYGENYTVFGNGNYLSKNIDGIYVEHSFNGDTVKTYSDYTPPQIEENKNVYKDLNKSYNFRIDNKQYRIFSDETEINPIITPINDGSFIISNLRYDNCGKYVGKAEIPEDVVFKPEEVESPEDIFVHTFYGSALVSEDGAIYSFRQTPSTFTVLKWTWIDSPDDPKGGPDAPADLKVAPATTGLSVTWTASPQDPGCVEGYEVERSSTSGGIFSNITTTAPGVIKYSDTSILPGSSAFYRVRAKSTCGSSPYTAEVSGKRP